MITLKKLATLPQGTKVRKSLRLLESFQNKLRLNQSIDKDYLEGLIAILLGEVDDPLIRSKLLEINLEEEILWPLSDALFLLQQALNIERGDWDFLETEAGKEERQTYPFTLVLDRLRSPFNVGSIFRTAESFGVEQIYLVEPSAAPSHPRAMRSGRGCQEEIPHQSVEEGELIELLRGRPSLPSRVGAKRLPLLSFPKRGSHYWL